MSTMNPDLRAILQRMNAAKQTPAVLSRDDQKRAERIDRFAQLTPEQFVGLDDLIVEKSAIAADGGFEDDLLILTLAQEGFKQMCESLRMRADMEGGAA